MSSYYAGGYLFFSTLAERKALIELVLQTMELAPQDTLTVWLPRNEEEYDPTDLPREQALCELAQTQDGGFYVHAPSRPECYWFDQPAGSYQTVRVSSLINALDEKTNPGGPDLMAKRWLALCEQGKVDFGFFGQFNQMIEREYRDALLPALVQKDVKNLLADGSAYWLIYLVGHAAINLAIAQRNAYCGDRLWCAFNAFLSTLGYL